MFSENYVFKNKRKDYHSKEHVFTEKDLVSKDPLLQFDKWFKEAMNTPEIHEANSVCLATANRNGVPSARYLLLKEYGADGFKFFTNYNSRKGKDLEENPQAALTFYWAPLNKSVRIEGKVKKMSETDSLSYFQSRPRDSQITANVSKQSSIVADRETMLHQTEELTKEFDGKDVPKPKHWGGYIVVPESIEFWQGQTDRLHDRIKFRKLGSDEVIDNTVTHMGVDDWVYERLYP